MKFIDLQKQFKLIELEINQDIESTLNKCDFILGKKVFDLEQKLSKYVGVAECITCASGTDALLIPLMARNIGIGDAVFTTNFSFFATTEVISHIGASPIFIDVDLRTFNLDPELLENQIVNTIKMGKLIPKAIIAVNLFGQLADYNKIEKIAKKYNLFLIEDAAQSFGASYKGKQSCSFGNISATSFFPAKPLGCYGDGGAIFTNDKEFANICRSIRVHGMGKDKYDNVRIGMNSRLDTIQATILLNKLKIFNNEIILRHKIAKIYSDNLNQFLIVPHIAKGNISSWAQYSLLCNSEDDRDALLKHLDKKNIPTAIYYKKPFHLLDLYKDLDLSNDSYKTSEKLSKCIFSIPMHPYLSDKDLSKILESIQTFFNK